MEWLQLRVLRINVVKWEGPKLAKITQIEIPKIWDRNNKQQDRCETEELKLKKKKKNLNRTDKLEKPTRWPEVQEYEPQLVLISSLKSLDFISLPERKFLKNEGEVSEKSVMETD